MPTTLRTATRVARKPHRCGMCNAPIGVGERHHVSTNLFDGQVYDWRECQQCTDDRICNEVYHWWGCPDEGVGYESAWEWAHECRDDPALGHAARAWLTRSKCACERCDGEQP